MGIYDELDEKLNSKINKVLVPSMVFELMAFLIGWIRFQQLQDLYNNQVISIVKYRERLETIGFTFLVVVIIPLIIVPLCTILFKFQDLKERRALAVFNA